MANLTSDFNPASGLIEKPTRPAIRVYSRLIRYAWRYKARLTISLLLAVLIAVSLGAILGGIGGVVKLTFYDLQVTSMTTGEAETASSTSSKNTHEDPAIKMAQDIRAAMDWMQKIIGTAPKGLDQSFLSLVQEMRARKMLALTVACVFTVVLSLIINVARFLQEYYAGSIGASISTDLGGEMYENLMRQSVGFFESRSSGEILARFTNDIFMVNRGLAGVFVKLMREPFKALVFLFVAFSADVWLTLLGICVLPPVVYALVRIGKKMRRSVRRSLEKIASMASVVNETVIGVTIVKGYNMEDYEIGRVRVEINKLKKFLYRMVELDALTGPVTEFVLVAGVVIFILISGHRVLSGRLDAGDLVTLYFALAMMLDPVRKLSSVNNMIQTSVASAERVFEFIDAKPDMMEAPDAVDLPPLRERLSFENIHFSYDGQTEVLKGISLEVRKGELVAIVGFSGAGKSTLAKLIPRFYDVTAGAIKIDDVDIRRATFRSLRGQMSIVTQDTVLFAESVRDNIAYGQTQFTEERVRDAARAAHAFEFIEKLPEGFNTSLGEAGGTLSGGQRQRLAIARAIIKDPAILILDEATSNLDSESEQYIQQALDKFVTGRTSVVIAHRLSTVQRADLIVVLDDGRIVEQGTHAELLAHGGIYRRLYDTQFGAQPKTA